MLGIGAVWRLTEGILGSASRKVEAEVWLHLTCALHDCPQQEHSTETDRSWLAIFKCVRDVCVCVCVLETQAAEHSSLEVDALL
eukprot:3278770-Amphidinium_carterae.1